MDRKIINNYESKFDIKNCLNFDLIKKSYISNGKFYFGYYVIFELFNRLITPKLLRIIHKFYLNKKKKNRKFLHIIKRLMT